MRAALDWYDIALAVLITLNVLAVVLQSVETIGASFEQVFYVFEAFSVAVFTVEYVTRVWACTADRRYAHPFYGRLRYIVTGMALIDLASFAPFYVPMLLPYDLRFLGLFDCSGCCVC